MSQNNLEKYAAEAYSLLTKVADEAGTYAGEYGKAGLTAGAVVGAGKHLYDYAAYGKKPTVKGVGKGALATAALWGVLGGLGGGLKKRRVEPSYEYDNYGG